MSLLSTVYSQTKNKIDGFWGMKFGQILTENDYEFIKKKCSSLEYSNNRDIDCYDVYFAGYIFNYAEIEIYDRRLYSGEFVCHSKNADASFFKTLKSNLEDKYGNPQKTEIKSDKDMAIHWWDDFGYISLRYEYAESKGGEFRFYTKLYYSDFGELFKMKIREEYNDL